MLNLTPEEKILDCVPVRNFDLPGHFLMMATKKGIVKKTALDAYSRPKKGGIIAIKLREDDELVDVVITKPNDQIVLSTANGMAIRFAETDARPMGRNTSGVKGISLRKGDEVVGMVVADPDATLLTACEFGYGKRTTFGPGDELKGRDDAPLTDDDAEETVDADVVADDANGESDDLSSSNRYRTQRRGGKGVIDIKASKRNGRVVTVTRVDDDDELIMMSTRGKIQRIFAKEINVIGRNTQGVRIMSLDEGDALAAIVVVPPDANEQEAVPALPPSAVAEGEGAPDTTEDPSTPDSTAPSDE